MANPNDPKFADENFSTDPFSGLGEGGGDPFNFAESAPQESGGIEVNPVESKVVRKKAASGPVAGSGSRQAAQLAADIPVQVVAVLGKKSTTVKEIVSLKKGQILELNRFPNEAIDLVANGKLMAKGELVEIDGKLGVRIIKIFE